MIGLIRAILLYLLIIFCLRLMGKRQLGELQPSELVITILISNIASLPIEDTSIPMSMGVIPIIVFAAFELVISSISLKSKKFRSLISGKPIVIIRGGKIDQNAMRRLRFSVDDLMEALREKSIFDLAEVQYAIVETTGQVSVLQKHPAQTVTAEMLHIAGESADPPVILISDGVLLRSGLTECGLRENWVENVLQRHSLKIPEVFLLAADSSGKYTLIPRTALQRGAGK